MKLCDVVLNSVWHDPRVRKQIIEYQKEGIEVCAVGLKCTRYNEEKVAKLPCPTTIVDYDLKYRKKLKTVFAKLKRERIIQKAVEKAIIDFHPDIIHANDLDALIPAYHAAKKLKCRLIYDSHEVWIENFISGLQRVRRFMLEYQERKIVRKVDQMVCVSHAAASYFAKKYHIPTPMVITNCTIKADQVRLPNKHTAFEVLNHGQFYEGRGFETMVEALPLLRRDPEIKVVFRGLGRLEKRLRARAEEVGNENFIMYPPVTVEELIPEASLSMVGVAITIPACLNFKLSVSNRLFEYAAAGLPVIMSDIPEHRYLNEKYHFGIILAENTPECFADAVFKLKNDCEFYRTCAENALLVSKEVNWENEFAKLLSVIRKMEKDG